MTLSSSTTVQPKPQTEQSSASTNVASLLAALIIAMYAAKKTRKQLRKLKGKLAIAYLKEILRKKFNRITSLFSRKPAPVSDRTLLYILLGLVVLVLIFIEPVVAIAVLLLGILLILLTQHGFGSQNQ